jgi:eukaryotic-like serine/threonine-protein kinase
VCIDEEAGLEDSGLTRVIADERPIPEGQLKRDYILVKRYKIIDVIGVGGMGSVYRARDLHFPNVMKIVAVKEMINSAPDPLVRRTIVQNFEREANILVTLSHPSIPKIYDYFTFNERSYLVLEYIQGKDMESILETTTDFFPEAQAVAWSIELCDVLHYLHTLKPEPIIFRDIKPSNIMINKKGHVVLIDFGIAKIFTVGQKGTMIGTEGYAPPEQYRGEADQRSDIYALGATMHHLLTRRDPRLDPPFSFPDHPIRKINSAVSKELEMAVNKALQYDQVDRYASTNEMIETLHRVVKLTGIQPDPIASLTGVSGTPQGIRPIWVFKCQDEVRATPLVARSVVFVGSYDGNMYAINGADGRKFWAYKTEGGIVSRPVLQDGQLYFGSEDGYVYAVSARTGGLSWTFETGSPVRCSPACGDGHLFIGSDDGVFYAINLSNERATWRVEAGAPIRSMPVIEDGLVYFGTNGGELICVDMHGGVKWRFKAKRGVVSSPVLSNGVIYFTSLDSVLYAVEADSGWVNWRFRMNKGSTSTPVVSGKSLYVGSADGNIYCVNTESGKEIWRYKTDHQVSGSPVLYDGAVYCGSADGVMHCLEERTGRPQWKYSSKGPITGAPHIYGERLFFGSVDGKLYALPVR